ncbi:enoyl-CoA hydratase/isomerase family protein [Streptosporangium sp. NPDC000239]|uniref:enoyl-CoA hydratase/isomerase family protein n=1 Tax=Streptosporangium sp. NPDC000239 TaxID=3154248 RepID=UPI0033217887
MNLQPDAEVVTLVTGRLGQIILNRPRALNALNHGMIRRIDTALRAWACDDSVSAVLIRGTGERGLCAGGDIRAIHEDVRTGGGASPAFWRDEYRLNALIARYGKPYVALMDGIVMGGGVGVSAHGGVRIVTERTTLAMPETTIGFLTDVGGTYLLSRAPGELGTHMALTSAAIGAGDAVACGLADHFVPSADLGALTAELASGDVAGVVAAFARPVPPGKLTGERGWIDACYSAETVEEIVERLLGDGAEEAKRAAELVSARSPTALKVTLRALRLARGLGSLEEALDQEYRVACAMPSAPDLVEGIRAQVIDKDRSPRWSPARLEEVSERDVDRFFAPLGEHELGLSAGPG